MLESRNPAPGVRARRWVFGEAVLDEASMELRVGGQVVRMEPKPLEVLLFLLQRAGEVVTKDELAENLWPGRILTESVLTRCISLLRQALNDEHRSVVKTVHGFGYRLDASPKLEASVRSRPDPALGLKIGDRPPQRPQWALVRRLGTGGHGEAWLAKQEKTRDSRVFKFALDEKALGSLKREITLYRVLRDTLGDEVGVLHILEWNLEEAPYFLEIPYASGGNLAEWGEAAGGLSAVPLSVRIELVAQIADSLAAAHSVGVLHKDLKPSNILLNAEYASGGSFRPLIGDFGSGGVMDADRLEALGITRLGFTRTLSDSGPTAATPLYLAPEVLAGQPFTVKADMYALGVIVYQVIAGDLHKALAPGWEANINDELVREDIGQTAAGDPALRLADASQLARRLRSLASRHQIRDAEKAARLRAEKTQQALKDLRRTRVTAMLLAALTIAAIAGGSATLRARNEALAAKTTATAMNEFLMDDFLRVDTASERPRDASYESLLDRAAESVGRRLDDQPEAAGKVHWLLGRRFQEIGRTEAAAEQYNLAASVFAQVYGRHAEPTLQALDRQAGIYVNSGRIKDALDLADELHAGWSNILDKNSLSMYMVRMRIARLRLAAGQFIEGEAELRTIIQEIPRIGVPDRRTPELLTDWLGLSQNTDISQLKGNAPLSELLQAHASAFLASDHLLEYSENYSEAEQLFRRSLNTFQIQLRDTLPTAIIKWSLGYTLAVTGKHAESEQLISESRLFLESWLPAHHWLHSHPLAMLARLRIEQRRSSEAIDLLHQALVQCNSACSHRAQNEFRFDISIAHEQLEHWGKAAEILELSREEFEAEFGAKHIGTIRRRVRSALAHAKLGDLHKSETLLSGISPEGLRDLRADHPIRSDLYLVNALLKRAASDLTGAKLLIEKALAISEEAFGPSNWRTLRLQSEKNDLDSE